MVVIVLALSTVAPSRSAERAALGRRSRRAARRSSRPIRRIRIDSPASTSRSRRCSPRGVGRTPQFVNIQFTSIDQSIARGDAEIGLSGIEDTPARRATLSVTVPYYEFREVLSVRDADAGRLHALADLRGKTVATLGRHDRLRDPAARRAANTASRSSRTKTMCIRTAIW